MTAISESPVANETGRDRAWLISAASAGLLFAALALLGVLLRPPLPVDETRYLAVAWEMWLDKAFLVPHLNGAVYSQKPPLLFWLMDALWMVTGVSGLAARLIAPLFGVVSIFLTALLARRLWPEDAKAAIRAPWMLATSGLFLVYGSLTMFDTLLMASVLLALLGLLQQSRAGGWGGWPLFALALALGLLAKGPAVIVHTLPLAGLAFLWRPASSAWRALPAWYGGLGVAVLAAACVVALWFLPAVLSQGGGYLEAVVWNQGAGRIVSSFAHQKPFWFFAALAPLFFWPWGWRREALSALSPARLWQDQGGRFCLLWIGSAFFIHSACSGKQLHYLLPELPAIALILARGEWGGWSAEKTRWLAIAGAPLPLALLVAWAAHFGLVPPLEKMLGALPLSSLLLATAGAALLTGLLLLAVRKGRGAALLAPGGLVLFYLLATPVLGANYDGARVAQALARHEDQGLAYFGGTYSGEFTFQGRLSRPLERLETPAQSLAWAKAHPGGAIIARKAGGLLPWTPSLELPYRGSGILLWEIPQAPEQGAAAALRPPETAARPGPLSSKPWEG